MAHFDGTAWTATPTLVNAFSSSRVGGIQFQGSTGTNPARTVTIDLARIPGPGTYPLGVNLNSHTGGIALVTEGSQAWHTELNGAAGTITIAQLGATRITGSFSFTAVALGNHQPATRVVTQGEFDIPRHSSYVPATPAQLGSTLSATLNGTPFHAGTIVGTGTGGFSADNQAYTLTLVANFPGPGTYAMGSNPGALQLLVTRHPAGTGSWVGNQPAHGSFTITSMDASRVIGTFSGTIPSAGGALVIQNGAFNLRVP